MKIQINVDISLEHHSEEVYFNDSNQNYYRFFF